MGLILPAQGTAGGFTRTGSGLFVPGQIASDSRSSANVPDLVTNRIFVPSGSVTKSITSEAVRQAAQEGIDLLRRDGVPAGLPGTTQLPATEALLLDRLAAQERHDRVVSEFLRNRVEYGKSLPAR